jgi:hypothetical protein
MNKLSSFLRSSLARFGSFGRKREEGADEPAPSELADTVADVQTASDAPVESEDGRPSGFWSRLVARFGKREAAETDEAPIEAPEADAGQEEQAKGFWPRLMARFSLRKKAAGDEGEAEAQLPEAKGDKAERRGGGDKGAGGRAETLEEAPAEQPERTGIRGMLARKPVWISLVVLAVAGASAAGWFAVNEFRARSDAQARMLQQRNQALAEQNRKLQAENAKLAQAKNKPREPEPVRAPATEPGGEPAAGQARSAGSAAEDCTVKDKASVRDTLKGCIEGFNAGSGR